MFGKDCEIMSKTEILLNRIENLTDEQFELLVTLWIQQEQEFAQVLPTDPQTYLQPSA